jgi:hypothetical protein
MDQSKANALNASAANPLATDAYFKAQNAVWGDNSVFGRFVHAKDNNANMSAFGYPEVFKRLIGERGDLLSAHAVFASAWDGADGQPARHKIRTSHGAVIDIRDAEADFLLNPVVNFLKNQLAKIGEQTNLSFLMGVQIYNETKDPFLQQPIFEISVKNGDRFSAARVLG